MITFIKIAVALCALAVLIAFLVSDSFLRETPRIVMPYSMVQS